MRRTFTALELKIKCDTLIKQVEQTRKPIVITKDGKPIARLRPHRRKSVVKAGSRSQD
ncbi:MAG: type II toxin-antitoxin system Phd/YefM family antitoxin [Xanthobacteraceae bacterium]